MHHVDFFKIFPQERGVRNVASKMKELGMIGGGRGGRKNGGKSRAVTAVDSASEEETAVNDGGSKKQREKRRKKMVKKKSGVCSDVPRLVMSLSCRGYEEQLAWLEAYLRDEARDRTVDGGS